jgi:hypothetical protein
MCYASGNDASTTDKVGRFTEFCHGTYLVDSEDGVHAMYWAIRQKGNGLGPAGSHLGYRWTGTKAI